MTGTSNAGMEALGELLGGKKKLYFVRARRPDAVRSEREKQEMPWGADRAYVAASSIENASLKATQFFNAKNGVNDYEVQEVSLYASCDGDHDIYIE